MTLFRCNLVYLFIGKLFVFHYVNSTSMVTNKSLKMTYFFIITVSLLKFAPIVEFGFDSKISTNFTVYTESRH